MKMQHFHIQSSICLMLIQSLLICAPIASLTQNLIAYLKKKYPLNVVYLFNLEKFSINPDSFLKGLYYVYIFT